MLGRPPYSTRTYTPFPHTTLFGSSPDQPGAVAPPLLGLDRYGWGGEELDIPVLDVPQPLLGQPLVLIAGEQGRYTLLNEDDRSEEHTYEIQLILSTPYAVLGLYQNNTMAIHHLLQLVQ